MVQENSLAVSELRTLEERAKELGLTERLLIECASSNLCSEIEKLNLGRNIAVIAGRGNNGADVLSCARKLASRGYKVKTITLQEKPLFEEARFQKEILTQIGVCVHALTEESTDSLGDLISNSDVLLEGILGIGLKGEVSPFIKKAIHTINESGKTVIACDIPSGLLPDEGLPSPIAVRADHTITFIAAKKGFFRNEAREFCGTIHVVDIGISRELLVKQ